DRSRHAAIRLPPERDAADRADPTDGDDEALHAERSRQRGSAPLTGTPGPFAESGHICLISAVLSSGVSAHVLDRIDPLRPRGEITMIGRVFGAEAIPLAALLMLSAAGCGGGHRMSAGPDAVTGPSAGGGAPSGGGVLTDATAPADADAGNSRARPIDSPGTIAEPGDYRLTRDITVTDGDGLVVQASGVRLRLGGH